MKVNYELIGKRIKEHRQRRNLTQEMLAELVEMSPGYMSLIETGRKKASLETLLSICRVLSLEQFIREYYNAENKLSDDENNDTH